jgi:hypothetical protein
LDKLTYGETLGNLEAVEDVPRRRLVHTDIYDEACGSSVAACRYNGR